MVPRKYFRIRNVFFLLALITLINLVYFSGKGIFLRKITTRFLSETNHTVVLPADLDTFNLAEETKKRIDSEVTQLEKKENDILNILKRFKKSYFKKRLDKTKAEKENMPSYASHMENRQSNEILTPKGDSKSDRISPKKENKEYDSKKNETINLKEHADSKLSDFVGWRGHLKDNEEVQETTSGNKRNHNQTAIKKKLSKCPNNTLEQNGLSDYGKCQPHRPTLEACEIAERLHPLRPELHECDVSNTVEICTLDVVINHGKKILKVRCNEDVCREAPGALSVRSLNLESGKHDIVHNFSTVKRLKKALPKILNLGSLKQNNYVFLQCQQRNYSIEQLLPISPLFTIKDDETKARPDNVLNVNIILLDSVSRAHFYRSLPKTVELFKSWTRDAPHSPAQVFDFELFQAVEGHTMENTHALFTGTLFPASSDRDAKRYVGMDTMFGHFRHANYQTMWQEDLCWEGFWGLFVDLALKLDWNKELGRELKRVFIDETGVTHSSCEILKHYDLTTPFNGPEGNKICFNGKFQYSYLLQYILDTLKAIETSRNALPLFSYMSLNVGHEDRGLRVQTFDRDFVKYAKEFAQRENTLTILLSDHGNTYTDYTVSIEEGRFEMFHPSLFIIVPNNVAKLLGNEAMETLRTNQRRLVNMIDMHHTVMALAGPLDKGRVTPTGVFTPISLNRTCNDMELRTPNLCVCDGWDSPTTNDTLKLALVEFAIGELNNRVLETKAQSTSSTPEFLWTGSCMRLQPVRFENVRERNSKSDGSLITGMDIVVPAGDVVPQKEDLFRVEVKTTFSPSKLSLDMTLFHYERLSMFGKYKSCADDNANLKLCVCSRNTLSSRQKTRDAKALVIANTERFFDGEISMNVIDMHNCVYLIKRVHDEGDAYAYEVANMCLDSRPRDVHIVYFDCFNIKASRNSQIRLTVLPGTITFVFSARKDVSYHDSQISVTAIA